MIVVIDIGNTTVTLSGIEGDRVLFSGTTETNRGWDADTYESAFRPILEGIQCEGAVLSSVVPQITDACRESCRRILGKNPMVVSAETKTGLTIDLPEPEKVGRDRLADAAWAAEYYPLPAVTADLGTASTFNVILPGKIFAGGIICAGIQTGLNALADHTSQLPRLQLRKPQRIVGKNTEECMLSGAVAGTAAMIDGLVRDIEEEIGSPVTLLLTGGGGQYVTDLLRHDHIFDPDMTRKGLALLYEKNTAQPL